MAPVANDQVASKSGPAEAPAEGDLCEADDHVQLAHELSQLVEGSNIPADLGQQLLDDAKKKKEENTAPPSSSSNRVHVTREKCFSMKIRVVTNTLVSFSTSF